MDKWREIPLSKEEEEGVIAEEEEVCGEEIFQRTLAGKLWTDNSFNSRAFTSTMTGAWKLKNPVEIQELSKNLYLFRFATKRDLESVLRNGPWSFDRNLLILTRVSGEEQPSALNMHFGTFWVRIYELPLMLRTESMARKLGGILGSLEEVDQNEAHRNGRFLRIKVSIDLNQPLKRGTMVRFKEKNLRIYFKYERLPTFCFVCGKVGHQLKDCDSVEDLSEEGFEELDEQELSYGTWLRASPLPKITDEQRKKETKSSSCSKSLFNVSSGQSGCGSKNKEKEGDGEVEQKKDENGGKGKEVVQEKAAKPGVQVLEIEAVAEFLGAVDISNIGSGKNLIPKGSGARKKKWTRKSTTRKTLCRQEKKLEQEIGKRPLVDVMIIEGNVDECGSGEKKRRSEAVATNAKNEQKLIPEVVLEDQHRLTQ
ncbi:uncharacterized protein LOC131614267 [Vicia villosa]|uniref:uncharacterized protein LOC131614267 n=1 Tax=Vicia villosa TaxID=3911 RepID=UPI00273B57AE|nr:uncharacterized protein LOC131614267 [Vicia villosa]